MGKMRFCDNIQIKKIYLCKNTKIRKGIENMVFLWYDKFVTKVSIS